MLLASISDDIDDSSVQDEGRKNHDDEVREDLRRVRGVVDNGNRSSFSSSADMRNNETSMSADDDDDDSNEDGDKGNGVLSRPDRKALTTSSNSTSS